jgi:microcystin-dependent protein
MTVLTGLTTFTAGTPAVASQVNTNFAAVKSYVDALSAGTNIDNGTIGVAKLSAAATGVLSPIGSIVQYIGATEPNGNWKICDGQTLLIASYPDLYALLTTGGTVFPWGANPSATTFVVPNFSGRIPVAKSVEAEFDALGETGGAKTVALTEAQLASHNHTQNAHNHTQDPHNHTQNPHNHTQDPHGHTIADHTHTNQATFIGTATSHAHNNTTDYVAAGTNGASTTPTIASISTTGLGANANTATNQANTATNNANTATNQATTATNNATGSGAAHNNLQPYIVVNYIIKVL